MNHNKASSLQIPKLSSLKILLVVGAVFYGIFIARTSFRANGQLYFTLVDDAMISMRYAHHLAQGDGLVWNVGEKPVEGFTNPGWMLMMAFMHELPLDRAKVSLAVMILSAVTLLANSVVAREICREIKPGARHGPWIAAVITAFYFPLVFWSLRGMEVGILALLVDLGILAALRLGKAGRGQVSMVLAILVALALVIRLDALPQVAILLAYVVSGRPAKSSQRALPVLLALLTVAGILWFQHAYFGDFLPNTYYEKVVGTSAVERIKSGLLAFNQYATRDTLMLALVTIAGVLLHQSMRRRETILLMALFAVQCAYSIWVGGDYAEPEVAAANRFITEGMTPLIICFSLAVDGIISDVLRPGAAGSQRGVKSYAVATGVACAALLIISGQPWINWGIDNAPLLKSDIRRVKVGLAIAGHTSPSATIAVHAAGQIPYYSDRRTIDLLGLNDPVIAKGPLSGPFYPGHDKWNYDYSILQLRPDLIADNWIRLGDYMRDKVEYRQLANGMYVRTDSVLVDAVGLTQAIP